VLAAAAAAVLMASIGTGLVLQHRATPAESAPPTTTVPSSTTTAPSAARVTPAPVVEQPVVQTPVRPPVHADQQKGKKGKGKGKP
jgi:hypothetical protein